MPLDNMQDPTQNLTDAQAPQAPPMQPGKLASFGHGLLSTLAGGDTQPEYSINPDTGATVTTQVKQAPGQMFKTMLAGMLSGLAGGVQANANGAPGGLAALAGGYAANDQRLRQNDMIKRKQAQSQFDDQQTATMNKAHLAKMNQEAAESAFKMARLNTEIQTADIDKFNNLEQTIASTPGAEKIGTYKDFPSFLSSMGPEQQADLIKKQAAGEITLHPVLAYDSGNPRVVGVDVYHIPTSYLNKPIDKPMQIGMQHNVDPKTGIDHPIPVIAPVGSITVKEALALNQGALKDAISQKDIFNANNAKDIQSSKNTAAMDRLNTRIDDLQARNAPIEGSDLTDTIDGITSYSFDPARLSRAIGKDPSLLGKIHKADPNFSEPAYRNAVKVIQSYGSGQDHRNMVAIGTAIQHASSLRQLIDKLPATGDTRILNGAINTLAKQAGLPEVTNVETLANALGEELAKGYKNGVPDVALQKSIHDGLSTGAGHKQLAGTLDTHAHAQWQRLGEMAGEFQSQVPHGTDKQFTPNISRGAEQALHSFGLDNPFNFGQGPKPLNGGSNVLQQAPQYVIDQFKKLAGNDNNKAAELARKRGWQ